MIVRKLLVALLFLIPAAFCIAKPPYVVVLGTAQDAGAPQMGCRSPFCRRAWNEPGLRKRVSSIALVEPDTGRRWIFDATPDLPWQFQSLKTITGDNSNSLSGIFLTHAHIGHYTGLMYLGRESMNTSEIPVYAMPRMRQMLRRNAPWSQLIDLGNIKLRDLRADEPVKLSPSLQVTPFLVPHRDEFSETVGYRIGAGNRSLVFIPDIDKWNRWGVKLTDLVRRNDFLLIDGTFFADGEIARPISEVPHPFVLETMDLLKNLSKKDKRRVHFIHFNHTNPLLQGDRVKLKIVERRGFNVARRGQRFTL